MFKAAILVAEGVQDEEFIYPYYRLQEFGCELDVVLSPYKLRTCDVAGKYGIPIKWNKLSSVVTNNLYDLIVIPGGWQCPEILRMDKNILALVEKHFLEGKIIAAICHGSQVLISALHNTEPYPHLMMTGYKGIMHDIINAGFSYVDKSVVIDTDNCIITAQHYKDNPEFMKTVLNELSKQNH